MRMKTSTTIRLCATALLLAATSLGGLTTTPGQVKDAVGCSLSVGRPSRGACSGGSEMECYECYYNYGSVELVCYESTDGSISYCSPIGSNGPYPI